MHLRNAMAKACLFRDGRGAAGVHPFRSMPMGPFMPHQSLWCRQPSNHVNGLK